VNGFLSAARDPPTSMAPYRNRSQPLIWTLLWPIFLYFGIFCVLTYPAIINVRSLVLTDTGDGLQNLWNLWWVHYAVVILHQSPWVTSFLHYPYGTSLIGHTLNPFNGFVALALLPWLSLAGTYNILLIGSFVMTGWTTFLLTRRLGIAMNGSVLSGAIVTFSNYHFSHAQGHLQLVSFEWVPVFFLFLISGLEKPTYRNAVGAAVAFFLVLLCDYYYAFYALLGAAILATIFFIENRLKNWRLFPGPAALFVFLSVLGSGPFVLGIRRLARIGAAGIHSAFFYSMDLLAPFIPGGHWRFAFLTQSFWSRWTGNIHENSVYVGWSVIGLASYGWFSATGKKNRSLTAWFSLMIIFFTLALGPFLQVGGHLFRFLPLPYGCIEKIVPVLRVSGCPVRMMSMVILSCAIAAGAGFSYWQDRRPSLWAVRALLAFMAFEYWPQPLPATRLDVPGYIQTLAAAPPGGVVDAVSSPSWMLYYQTIHEKPLGLGYISRIPNDVRMQDEQIIGLYRQGHLQELHEHYKFRYFVLPAVPAVRRLLQKATILFDDNHVILADLSA